MSVDKKPPALSELPVDTVVHAGKSSNRKLHYPKSPDDSRPLCAETFSSKGTSWRRTTTAVWPDDYRDVCSECARIYDETEGYTDEPVLPPKQREALDVAVSIGYFSVPREATLTDLGDVLGVTSTAAGERLRRASGNLAEAIYGTPDRETLIERYGYDPAVVDEVYREAGETL